MEGGDFYLASLKPHQIPTANYLENKSATLLGALMEVRMGPRTMGSQSLKPSAEVFLKESLKGLGTISANIYWVLTDPGLRNLTLRSGQRHYLLFTREETEAQGDLL